jgi:DNA-binding LacI/PurR family transcriptional regulator
MSEKLTAKKIPFAVAGSGYDFEDTIQVSANNYQGAGIVTKHLISLGHKRIGLIAENINTPYSMKKEKGFMDMMSEHGLEVTEEVLIISENKQERKVLLESLMRKKDRPTAFFCFSDMYAIATIMTLVQSGFSVPDDVSVVGYANTMTASHCVPALTTIDERYSLTGEIIADKILEKINNPGTSIPSEELVDVQLIVRESSAPVKMI